MGPCWSGVTWTDPRGLVDCNLTLEQVLVVANEGRIVIVIVVNR